MSKSGADLERRESAARCDDGFTLVEALVALAVFAIAFAGIYRALDGGFRALRQASQERALIEVARARLASASIEAPLAEGRTSGESAEGIVWEVEIRHHAVDATAKPLLETVPRAYRVSARAWQRPTQGRARPTAELTTIRLATEPRP